jgi:hypothetical protein
MKNLLIMPVIGDSNAPAAMAEMTDPPFAARKLSYWATVDETTCCVCGGVMTLNLFLMSAEMAGGGDL